MVESTYILFSTDSTCEISLYIFLLLVLGQIVSFSNRERVLEEKNKGYIEEEFWGKRTKDILMALMPCQIIISYYNISTTYLTFFVK